MANEYGNYATFNSIIFDTGTTSYSEGNLRILNSSTTATSTPVTISLPNQQGDNGLYYAECRINAQGNDTTYLGAADSDWVGWQLGDNQLGYIAGTLGIRLGNDFKFQTYSNNSAGTYSDIVGVVGDHFRIAFDTNTGKTWVGFWDVSADAGYWLDNDGTKRTSDEPAAGTNENYTFPATIKNLLFGVTPRQYQSNNGDMTLKIEPDSWLAATPSGAVALGTQNLPTPAVINYEDEYYIEAGISHTNGSTTAVTLPTSVSGGAMARIKRTDSTSDWFMFDTVRGANKSKKWNEAEAEDEDTFDDQNLTGTTLTLPSALASGTYLVEVFYVGSYFQIQTVTGNAGARTITWPTAMDSYGFSAFFPRTGASSGISHHIGIGAQQILFCDNNSAAANRTNFSQAPNKTDFRTPSSVGPDFNLNTIPYVCYGWANSGPYAFGSYTGNSNADGTFINVGGRPQVFIGKPTTDADSWVAKYDALLGYNVNGKRMYLEDTHAVSTSTSDALVDFVFNGVKNRISSTGLNSSTYGNYVYMAFGIQPLTDGSINQGRAR